MLESSSLLRWVNSLHYVIEKMKQVPSLPFYVFLAACLIWWKFFTHFHFCSWLAILLLLLLVVNASIMGTCSLHVGLYVPQCNVVYLILEPDG